MPQRSSHTGRAASSPDVHESLRNVGAWRWITLSVSALCSPSIPSEVQKSPENFHTESKSANPAFILCKSLVCKILPSTNGTWNPSSLLLFVPSANLTHWEINIIFIILFHGSKFFSLSRFFSHFVLSSWVFLRCCEKMLEGPIYLSKVRCVANATVYVVFRVTPFLRALPRGALFFLTPKHVSC